MSAEETIHEKARDIPVYAKCDVLVVGGGPAGCAAAASAAEMGADTLLVERYGCLGGMSTAGLVVWIDRMTDWMGKQVISGFANDLLGRLPENAVVGPGKDIWGSKDKELVAYWKVRSNAFHDTVTWSPTVDPELFKIAYFNIAQDNGAKLLLHSWAVDVVKEGENIRGVVFESKSGRQAILAKAVIDTTGDGDIFAFAGSQFDTDPVQAGPDDEVNTDFVVPAKVHNYTNLAFLVGDVNMERYLLFRRENAKEYGEILERGKELTLFEKGHITPRNSTCLFMGPKSGGYNCLDVKDLTEVEIVSRRRMMKCLEFFKDNMPGFEDAWIMGTASQVGTRHSRRLRGVKSMDSDGWRRGMIHDDEIGVVPPPSPKYPNVSVPLGCLIPSSVDNLLVAGRNLSCDAVTHSFMREIPVCWLTGQAAGVTAAVALNSGVDIRAADVSEVQRQLTRQGTVLSSPR